jgi:integrase
MARNPVSISKRPTLKKGELRYYVRFWNENTGKYSNARSVLSIVQELGLNEKEYPPTSRTGALLIGQELLKRGGALSKKNDPLFADYCASMWDWDTSPYIQGRIARGLRIGRGHALHSKRFIENYVHSAFPALKLCALRPYMLETFILGLKKNSRLRNRSINAIIDAIKTPLKEAVRLGIIAVDPSASLQKLGDDRKIKGIPTEKELSGLLSLNLDPRIRCAILLGAACGLRLGEVQALKLENIEGNTLRVAHSWSRFEGCKSTKTGKERVVPLPEIIRTELLKLADMNPHGRDGFLMYGLLPDVPFDCRAIARGFMNALAHLTLGEKYSTATRAEKTAALQPWKERNITFHSLRHFANAELRGAVPDETLRKLTGHSTEAMTDHYDHTTEADLEALAKAQEARIVPFIRTA